MRVDCPYLELLQGATAQNLCMHVAVSAAVPYETILLTGLGHEGATAQAL
jgi:hypothetical protein